MKMEVDRLGTVHFGDALHHTSAEELIGLPFPFSQGVKTYDLGHYPREHNHWDPEIWLAYPKPQYRVSGTCALTDPSYQG